jgi:hypothetical protein
VPKGRKQRQWGTNNIVGKRRVPMKSNRVHIFTAAVLSLLAVWASAKPAAAQAYKGSFTLPTEVRWQNAVLPPGEYTFSMESAALPSTIVIRGNNKSAVVMTVGHSGKPMETPSRLSIERRGQTRFVRELYLAEIHLHLFYAVPKSEDSELLAQGPAATEQILLAKR